MVLVTPFSTYLSSEDYVQMNESFINLSFTPTEIMFIGVVALFIFIIFGGKNDDELEYESLNMIKPMVSKFETDEDKAHKSLMNYYSLGGFKRLRNTNYMYKLKVGYKENLVNGAIQ